jgi:sulfate adenylyltransferase large subunit
MDLLRFSTAGSVDDGKSTLIGRLLFDSKGVFDDQLQAVARSTVNRSAGPIDLSLLTDGLRAEREQGITIDVAYRYFHTPSRKFIIADTPGHEQYTRNMATGASTADLAIVLVDARYGVLTQSRRHTFIAALLGIRHLVVAVNKMDLVDWRQARFEQIVSDYLAFSDQLGLEAPTFIPLSALLGDNVVEPSAHMPWYRGPLLLHHLETVEVTGFEASAPLRFPVQLVIRPDLDFRGFAGQLAAGQVQVGDEVVCLPAGTRSKVARIATYDGDLQAAAAPASVTVLLEDEIDVSRGDMLVHPEQLPMIVRELDAKLVWMDGQPLDLARPYLVRHTSRSVRGRVAKLAHRIDVNTLEHIATDTLNLNEIAQVRLNLAQPLYVDAYADCRATGSFVLIDPLTNATVAAGMVDRHQSPQPHVHTDFRRLDRAGRAALHGHRALAIALEGPPELSARVAAELEIRLLQRGIQALRVDAAFAHPLTVATAAPLGEVAASLIERLIEAGHVVISDLPRLAEAGRLTPADLVRVSMSEGGSADLHIDAGELSAAAVVTRVLTWLSDAGLFAGSAMLGRGAGI